MKIIKGPFEVKSLPLESDDVTKMLGAMRMRFDKRFEGGLSATSVVSMIGTFDKFLGSGGYVAIEKIMGTVEGKQGSFYLQHSSLMNRNVPTQKIVVIPDSGTEELKGIAGEMKIDIEKGGAHFYTFEYEII
jgi:Protein of unknown function (DUF3224)